MRRRLLLLPPLLVLDYDYVDMGGSVLWATCNVGASSRGYYRLYFAWADPIGHDMSDNYSFNDQNYDWKPDVYNGEIGESTMRLVDDGARNYMGGDWRVPSPEEFVELEKACDAEWVTGFWDEENTGENGVLFTLKSDKSKLLFFPAAGYKIENTLNQRYKQCNYWTNDLVIGDDWFGGSIGMFNDNYGLLFIDYNSTTRYFGLLIRAVRSKPDTWTLGDKLPIILN